ncbi:hypothetical protein C0Q70_03605 [Pomacea canaliculata]|uniref:Nitrate/nitrite sensing protein domain-containing protein n=1 Tax=Pomacea canaliculata TaxID=400727 RepID=A0A2T7PT80_POMCA|nr:hypothetical protein C0Q70_03605 [Pomacea canaliculata]
MLTLTLLPTLALLIMSIVDVRDTAYKNVANTAIRDVVILSTEVGLFVHFLQRERGYTAMHASYNDQTTEKLVTDSFRETDAAMAQLNTWPGETQSTSLLESR